MANYLEIKDEKDKQLIAGMLVMNGYTVKIVVVKDGNRNKRMIQFEKNGGKKDE